MDGESHPLILDLSLESEFDRLGLTPFLMIEVFEPSLSLKPSIPSFFNPSVSLSHFLSRLPISAKRLAWPLRPKTASPFSFSTMLWAASSNGRTCLCPYSINKEIPWCSLKLLTHLRFWYWLKKNVIRLLIYWTLGWFSKSHHSWWNKRVNWLS